MTTLESATTPPTTDSSLTDQLNGLLADATVFSMKLRNFHWYVSGPQFFVLHAKFEELYNDWANKIDEIAERTLGLQGRPLPTLAAVLQQATLTEETGQPDAMQMVRQTLDDLQSLTKSMGRTRDAAEKAGDSPTFNLLDGYIDEMSVTMWMLRATLGN